MTSQKAYSESFFIAKLSSSTCCHMHAISLHTHPCIPHNITLLLYYNTYDDDDVMIVMPFKL